mmetsp:Transcript_6947/g.20662  ORF Transcript_6947/g.20662 Transcript_6947/m.20662 type:complete len:275 (-) Transcript_6947:379-1203(-)
MGTAERGQPRPAGRRGARLRGCTLVLQRGPQRRHCAGGRRRGRGARTGNPGVARGGRSSGAERRGALPGTFHVGDGRGGGGGERLERTAGGAGSGGGGVGQGGGRGGGKGRREWRSGALVLQRGPQRRHCAGGRRRGRGARTGNPGVARGGRSSGAERRGALPGTFHVGDGRGGGGGERLERTAGGAGSGGGGVGQGGGRGGGGGRRDWRGANGGGDRQGGVAGCRREGRPGGPERYPQRGRRAVMRTRLRPRRRPLFGRNRCARAGLWQRCLR